MAGYTYSYFRIDMYDEMMMMVNGGHCQFRRIFVRECVSQLAHLGTLPYKIYSLLFHLLR